MNRFLRGFAADRRGATVVEFALIAGPFLALVIGILETGLLFFAQEVLQTSTSQAARAIMTGQAQAQGMTSAQFQQLVCTNATPLLTCGNMSVNVQTFASFGAINQLNPVQNGAVNANTMNYQMGGPGDIVLVQVFYQWPVDTGPLNFNLADLSGNQNLLLATAVFRNEPY